MQVKWKVLKATMVLALLVAGLAGGGLAGTASAHGKNKVSRRAPVVVPSPAPVSGPIGQPFILVFD